MMIDLGRGCSRLLLKEWAVYDGCCSCCGCALVDYSCNFQHVENVGRDPSKFRGALPAWQAMGPLPSQATCVHVARA